MIQHDNLGARRPERDGHIEVDSLPRRPDDGALYWLNSRNGSAGYTHGIFKFPAKFHVPVVKWALGTFGRRGSAVLDPFTGSGTLQVEARRRGIRSYGIDVDPLSVMITRVKVNPIDPTDLDPVVDDLKKEIEELSEERGEVQEKAGGDISEEAYREEKKELEVPEIPNIQHWFRRYVILDLAKLKEKLVARSEREEIREFLLVCLAGVIRSVSNADPSPVSGLEVTSRQAEKNETRRISVFDDFAKKIEAEAQNQKDFWNDLGVDGRGTAAAVLREDARNISDIEELESEGRFSLVVTSPPYCRAVEYGRRHRLELFWLDFVETGDEHVALSHEYIGRDYVRVGDWDDDETFGVPALDGLLDDLIEDAPHRRRAVHHYFAMMKNVMVGLHPRVKPTGTVVMVVGNSKCAGRNLASADYIVDLAASHFELDYRFRYEIRNHYMQYGLWNGDGIKEEHVLVFKPK